MIVYKQSVLYNPLQRVELLRVKLGRVELNRVLLSFIDSGPIKPGRLGQEPVLLTAATGAPPPHSSLSLLGGYKIDLLEIYTQTSTKSILVSAFPNVDFKLTFLAFERYGFKR